MPTATPSVMATQTPEPVVVQVARPRTTAIHTARPTDTPKAQTLTATPTVTSTPANTHPPTATLPPVATPTVTLAPTVTLTPTITPTSTQIFTPTITSTPTPIPPPHLRHLAEKQYMLELINSERRKAGVPQVELGDNIAAQLHVESALRDCWASHWGKDGLKPYMRYSLAGGYQSNGENGSGGGFCIKASDGYAPLRSVKWAVERSMSDLMESPDHRRNILDKHHKKINIGLAFDRFNMEIAQHFEGDYVEYDELPSIENGVLHISGRTKNGAKFDGAFLYYDPHPTRLQGARSQRPMLIATA